MQRINVRFVCVLCLLICALFFQSVYADTGIPEKNIINLLAGESKTVALKTSADRISIGTKGVISLFMMDKLSLTIYGKSSGFATVLIQYSNGVIEKYGVRVSSQTPLMILTLSEQIREYLSPLKDVEVKRAGDKIIISGQIKDKKYKAYYEQVVSMYKDIVVDLVSDAEAIKAKVKKDHLVQVDVQIVEIKQDDSSELGIEWFADGAWELAGTGTGNLESEHKAGKWTKTRTYTANVDLGNMTTRLIALAKDGKARFLATPKLIVQSGEKASFLVGGEIPIAQSTGMSSSVDWKKYGTELEIAPNVKNDGKIFVDLQATVSDLDYSHMSGGYPSLLSKKAKTNLTVNDGSTFAIAGLLSHKLADNVSKVPWLGNMPMFGFLFKKTKKEDVRTETIIFITPHILKVKSPTLADPPVVSGIAPSKEMKKAISETE